jgi:ribonuclease HII
MTKTKPPAMTGSGLRRSMRLRGIAAAADASDGSDEQNSVTTKSKPERKRKSTTKKRAPKRSTKTKTTPQNDDTKESPNCLPRTREEELKHLQSQSNLQIIGVDEAGRGPLAGPVVAAAAIVPTDIPGITDSKKITKEEMREELYEKIISSPNARWAVAISDAQKIDDINILQATLESMRNAVQSIIEIPLIRTQGQVQVQVREKDSNDDDDNASARGGLRELKASSKIYGCYVICGMNDEQGMPIELNSGMVQNENDKCQYMYHALVDGNRLPKDMPCEAEAMVKGDSREYAIGAASILAKVTRDRLMHEYDLLFPGYGLKRHKGYPTAAHMAKVRELGASPIHRRTFAPLKHMSFDDDGNIIEDNS